MHPWPQKLLNTSLFNIGITHVISCINTCRVRSQLFEHEAVRPSIQTSSEGPGYRCPSLSCPWLACPRGASCPRISCPPPWLSSPPGGKLSRPVYLAPRPTQVKICTCYFVIFLYHFNELRSSISHKVRNWCLWG